MKYLFILFAVLVLTACSDTKRDEYIPPPTSVVDKQFNFHIVDDGIWRSSQPNTESLARMKMHGLKTVINLRSDSLTNVWEKRISDSLGLQYFNFGMHGHEEQDSSFLREILNAITDSENQPVIIHCLGGKDRTGLIVGLYEKEYLGRDIESIKKEMIMYGHDHKAMPHIFKTIENW